MNGCLFGKLPARPAPRRGFTLVASVTMMALLMVVAIGLLSLASIELRNSTHAKHQARAQSNARLALMLAIGELQRQAGPDTRATATAGVLSDSEIRHPNWTGVWSTRHADGQPWVVRNDQAGGLRDRRTEEDWDPEGAALAWLVSGAETGTPPGPRSPATASTIELVGPGTTGDTLPSSRVSAPRVAVAGENRPANGHYAWWVGDLGVKANIATPDAHEDQEPDRANPADGGWFRLLAAQEADASMFTDGAELDASEKRRFTSDSMPAVLGAVARERMQSGFHDFTTSSEGVLADMANGGLKRDLTAYFLSDGSIPGTETLVGINDGDNLVGPANPAAAERKGVEWSAGRHRFASPKYGLLRRWAALDAPFDAGELPAIPPKPEPSPRISKADELALSNFSPATLAAQDTPNLTPILVEGSMQFSMSWFRKIAEPGQAVRGGPFDVRQHLYPRVVLWNPYNIALTMDRAIIMIQGNGRQEVWMNGNRPIGNFMMNVLSQWIFFEGGRNPAVAELSGITDPAYDDPHIGSFYFTLPQTTFDPGECLVFSPAEAAEYNGSVIGRVGYSSLDSNVLTCEKPPHPSRNFYLSDNNIGGGIDFMPTFYWFAPTEWWTRSSARQGVENQGDDCRVILKDLGTRTNISFEQFDALPQIALISGSMQFGGGREPRIAWNTNEKMPLEELSAVDPVATIKPNIRTREGVRLRWFDEHLSNQLGSGALAGTPHFEEALLANWNPRAAYITRSPFDNIAGSLPLSGSGGGPWFFGAYTRDLFDEAVSWDAQEPVPRGGRYHGNPFGPPQESGGRPIVLFDVPRSGSGVISLGQLQHAKLSEFGWHPAYAVGQSLVDPRLGDGSLNGLNRTAPPIEVKTGGFNAEAIGWSDDDQRSASRDAWAHQARAIYQDYPETETFVYDLSYEVNRTLWDAFFLSTGDRQSKKRFLENPLESPLPNGRFRLAPGTGNLADEEALTDFHRAAYFLSLDGAFNVNSTSVEAWKSVLGATRRAAADGRTAIFPRVLDAPDGEWTSGDSVDNQAAWSGIRALTDDEIARLAAAIVGEVRSRGPFLSLADFVNRRLANNESGRMGPLQAAIEAAGINSAFHEAFPLNNENSLKDYAHPDNIEDATRLEQTLKPGSKAWGLPGYLTQGDVLQVLGPMLNARSDTFVVRAYGDATDDNGKVLSRAWCEAVVQRTPEPVDPDASGINSAKDGLPEDLGRRFIVKSFRWLSPSEV